MAKFFGTDGIRGTVGADLTTDLVAEVGRAFAAACREGALGTPSARPRVVVGRDTRPSGRALEDALIAGLMSGGADALLAGVLPTAGVAYLTSSLPAEAGIVISASHNPPGHNGLKFFGSGGWKLTPEAEADVEGRVGSTDAAAGRGETVEMRDAREMYLEHLTKDGRADLRGLSVVIDCANGAASEFAPAVFERLGATVRAINAEGDGERINEGCGALHPNVVAEMAAKEGAIGITLDGDADRVLLVDEEGNVVDGDGIIAVLAEHMRSEGLLRADTIVVTVMSNQALRRWCETEGISIVETPVGDRHVMQALRDKDLVLGGEQAGHVARLDQMTTGDGILIGLDVCGIVARRGTKLSECVPFRPLPQVLLNVPVAGSNGLVGAAGVRAAVEAAEGRLGSDGRVLVRPSGTEPLVRVMVEGPDAELAGELAESVAQAVRHVGAEQRRQRELG